MTYVAWGKMPIVSMDLSDTFACRRENLRNAWNFKCGLNLTPNDRRRVEPIP